MLARFCRKKCLVSQAIGKSLPAQRSRSRETSVFTVSPKSHAFGYGQFHSTARLNGFTVDCDPRGTIHVRDETLPDTISHRFDVGSRQFRDSLKIAGFQGGLFHE